MQMKIYSLFVDSVIEERLVNMMERVGRDGGWGIKSLKCFAPRPVGQSCAYIREINIGGYRDAG
jgi:hypothetical protein